MAKGKVAAALAAKRAARVSKVEGKRNRGGRPPGGPKTGGRAAGTPNKRTVELREALEAAGMGAPGGAEHPVLWMFRVYAGQVSFRVKAAGPDGKARVQKIEAPPELRVRCAAEVAEYLEPKRKRVELSGADGAPLPVYLLALEDLPPSGKGVQRAAED